MMHYKQIASEQYSTIKLRQREYGSKKPRRVDPVSEGRDEKGLREVPANSTSRLLCPCHPVHLHMGKYTMLSLAAPSIDVPEESYLFLVQSL
jgi:hypothetical protein